MVLMVVGCEPCGRWTRVVPGTAGLRYPHHKPGCPNEGTWTAAVRPEDVADQLAVGEEIAWCRRCVECVGEDHHWIEDYGFAEFEPDHPAAKAGLVAWQNCKHCPAYRDDDDCDDNDCDDNDCDDDGAETP